MLLIHYGSGRYDPTKFKPIKNLNWGVKPKGGLWTSPIDSKYGWRVWCETEEFRLNTLNKSFTVELNASAKVLKIDSLADLYTVLDTVLDTYPMVNYGYRFPDWELLAEDYDAVWLTEAGQWATRMPKDLAKGNLYGWDCETVLILNKDCFTINT